MVKNKIISYTAVFSVFLLILTVAAFSTDYIETVDDSAFEKKTRPPAAFFHDAHNETAGIDDCSVCHHLYEDGQKTDDMSVGMECSECHMSAPEDSAADLIRAYHLQCGGCHMEQKAGPIMCGECHRKN